MSATSGSVVGTPVIADIEAEISSNVRSPISEDGSPSGGGGSFGGGAGPMVVNGQVFAASGYGLYFHMPGNVLLVFAPRAQ